MVESYDDSGGLSEQAINQGKKGIKWNKLNTFNTSNHMKMQCNTYDCLEEFDKILARKQRQLLTKT